MSSDNRRRDFALLRRTISASYPTIAAPVQALNDKLSQLSKGVKAATPNAAILVRAFLATPLSPCNISIDLFRCCVLYFNCGGKLSVTTLIGSRGYPKGAPFGCCRCERPR
jgi:hypothetical protein